MSILSEIKVVELASVLAGPLVGSFFAEAGAQVIKFEKPNGGDISRAWRNSGDNPSSPFSSYFASANYGKIYLQADLYSEEGRNAVIDALREADILLTNFKKGDAEKFGLTQDFLHQEFPKLIHGQITGFGEESDRTAFDMVLQAEMGFLSMTGTPENKAKIPVAMIDILAAHQLKEGLLLALMQRQITGRGAHVTASLYDSALSALINQGSAWLMNGLLPQALGTLHPSICPYGEILVSKDKMELVLAIGNDHQFKLLCQILGDSSIADDSRYQSNPKRVENRKSLLERMNTLAKMQEGEVLFKAFIDAHLPVGRVRTLDQVFSDKEAQALVLEEIEGEYNTKRVAGNVFRIYPNP